MKDTGMEAGGSALVRDSSESRPKRNRIIKRLPGTVTRFGSERYNEFYNLISQVHVSYYQRFLLMYEGSTVHITVEIILAVAGLFSTALYIVSTYSDDHSHDVLAEIELWLAIFFAVDFFVRLAANGFAYLRTHEGLIDLLAVIPLISSAGDFNIDPVFRIARVNITVMRLLKPARILRVFRLIRFVRVYKLMLLMRDSVKQRLLIHFTIGMSIVLVCGGLFQFLEDTFSVNMNRALHESVFFAMQTLTGLGFGQVTPTCFASQMLAVLMAFLVWALVPIHCVTIINLTRNVGSCVSYFVPSPQPRRHCILILLTHCTEQELDEFFREFFHPCHGPTRFRVAVLGQRSILEAVAPKLSKRNYINCVDFVAGSVFDDNDLTRCSLDLAAAVFTITHRICISHERSMDDDNQTLLAAISIKNMCPDVPVYLQVNSPLLEDHILWKTICKFPNIQLICTRQLALSLLGRSCACPGMNVLIGNLLQSIEYDPIHYALDTWQGEYHWGACHCLFPTVFGKFFDGKKFEDCILPLREGVGVLPIAMTRSSSETKFEVDLNPLERVIKAGDLVYVIARNLDQAAAVANFSSDSSHRFLSRLRHSQQLQTDALKRNSSDHDAFQMKVCCPQGLSLRSAVHPTSNAINLSRSSTKPFDRIQLGNHIIIVGFVEELVFEFIWNLRNQIHTADVPVIVAVRNQNVCAMSSLRRFPSVYIVSGSLQDDAFLTHINIIAALHVVLFSNPAFAFDPLVLDLSAKSTHQKIINSDLDTITNLIAIEQYLARYGRLKASNCVTEFQYKSNLSFVRPNLTPHVKAEANFLPDFADAKVHFAEAPQSMAALSFYYPHMFNLVQAFLYGSPIISTSNVKVDSSSASNLVMQLNLIRIPEKMQNEKYGNLLRHFTEVHGHLCLGLFRSKSQRNSPIPYVFLNPDPETIVCDDDHAFVIAPVSTKEPGFIYSTKGSSKTKVVTSLYKTKIPNLSSCLQDLHTDKSGIIQIKRHASESDYMLRMGLSSFKRRSRSGSIFLRGLRNNVAVEKE